MEKTTDELINQLNAVKQEMIDKCNELARILDDGENSIDICELDICEGNLNPISLIPPLAGYDVDCLLQCVGDDEVYLGDLSAGAVIKIMQHLQHLCDSRKRYSVPFSAKDGNIELKGEIVVLASSEADAVEKAGMYIFAHCTDEDCKMEVATSAKEVE